MHDDFVAKLREIETILLSMLREIRGSLSQSNGTAWLNDLKQFVETTDERMLSVRDLLKAAGAHYSHRNTILAARVMKAAGWKNSTVSVEGKPVRIWSKSSPDV